MFRTLPAIIALIIPIQIAVAAELIVPADSPIVVYQSSESYDDIKSNLELAITGRGMRITNTLHISEMLNRTAADTGLTEQLYENAESLEFCSIVMSFRMSKVHPANMATCPLTLSIYQKAGDIDHTFIAYRRPILLGDASSVEKDLSKLIDDIVQESLE